MTEVRRKMDAQESKEAQAAKATAKPPQAAAAAKEGGV